MAMYPPDQGRSSLSETKADLGGGLPPGGLSAMRQQAAENAMGEGDYVDVLGQGGWGYRLYPDGKIKITLAPEGHKAGQTLTGGPAYDAILAEVQGSRGIGPEPIDQGLESPSNPADVGGPPEETAVPTAERLANAGENVPDATVLRRDEALNAEAAQLGSLAPAPEGMLEGTEAPEQVPLMPGAAEDMNGDEEEKENPLLALLKKYSGGHE